MSVTGCLTNEPGIPAEWLALYHRWLSRGPKRKEKSQNKFGRFPQMEDARFAELLAKQREVKLAMAEREQTYPANGAE